MTRPYTTKREPTDGLGSPATGTPTCITGAANVAALLGSESVHANVDQAPSEVDERFP